MISDQHNDQTSFDMSQRGVNKWLTPLLQWVLCVCIVAGVIVVICIMPSEPKELNITTFISSLILVLVAYGMFYGLVSHVLNQFDSIVDVLITFVLALVFAKLRVLIPYLAGCFAMLFFLLPVASAGEKKLVAYDFQAYVFCVMWSTGFSNALTAAWVNLGIMSPKVRWISQSLGWPLIMSSIVVIPLLMGWNLQAYRLSLDETFRYYFFQTAVYTMIYYGFCAHIEAILPSEKGGEDVKMYSVVIMTVCCLLSCTLGKAGNKYICAGLFALLVSAAVTVCIVEAPLF